MSNTVINIEALLAEKQLLLDDNKRLLDANERLLHKIFNLNEACNRYSEALMGIRRECEYL